MSQDDVVAALEEELIALTRRRRARARELAHAIHPRLDPTAYPLVLLLGRRPGLRLSDIATELSLDKSTVSRQVDAVERLGLVERVPDPSDSRARLVVLTGTGHAKVTGQQEQQRKHWREALRSWAPEDVAELTRLLRRLADTGVV